MDFATLAGTLTRLGATILGGALAGPAGAAMAPAILSDLGKALGTAGTADAVAAAINADPAAAGPKVLGVEAAKGTDYLAELNARLADVQNARAAGVRYAEIGGPNSYAPIVVSSLVVIGFLGMAVLLMFRQVPDSQLAIVVFTTLSTGFGMVLQYWLGSSSGSASKDQVLGRIATAASAPSAGQIAGKVIDAAVSGIRK